MKPLVIALISLSPFWFVNRTASTQEVENRSQVVLAENIRNTWTNPPSEHPEINLRFYSNGLGYFVGGFEYLNPVKWELNPADSTIHFMVDKLEFTYEDSYDMLGLGNDVFIVDYDKMTLELLIRPSMDKFNFLGFIFFDRSKN